ncbi:MAG: flagellar basal body rod protein FlgB [Peptococcaceae bacterium]|jgi:flagellar basal-body rod protein FlgB|nr:flagellar basal body rod protein FlgB [Peptococcaceae bacterium]MDH7524029.1 flagellar basal body rod protein FlgB [Peptococcaceae bacterium]
MFKTKLFDLLEKAMEGSALKNTVTSNNISNVNTPGYKRKDVDFKAELKKSIDSENKIELIRTRSKHLPGTECGAAFEVAEIKETSLRRDGNNVDIDMELASLAENNIYFNGLAQLLSSQLSLLKHTISEGRR